MNVTPVNTLAFKSAIPAGSKRVDISNPFLYRIDENAKPKELSSHSFGLTVGGMAVAAVILTLLRLRTKNVVPESIVELANPNIGLNKINFPNAVKFLKKKVLYPIKAAMEGDEKFIYGEKLKSGLILTAENAEDAKKTIKALTEHAKELGIYCMEMPQNLKRNGRVKWVYKAIEKAKEYHTASNGDYVLINIGDISNLASLKISKSQNTKVEEKLLNLNKETYPGVIWAGWTNEASSLPYSYNNAPVIITKLVD